jgi:hypothetical protein
MVAILKRYGVALLILLFVVGLMLIGTHFVEDFGNSMMKDSNITMKPRGEKVVL